MYKKLILLLICHTITAMVPQEPVPTTTLTQLIFQKLTGTDEKETNELIAQSAPLFSPNAFDETGTSLLVRAINQGYCSVVGQLLNHGASPTMRCNDYFTTTPLINAVRKSPTLTELLLLSGADPNASDRLGITPLLVAVMRRDLSTINLLIRHGALINTQTTQSPSTINRGTTALIRLAQYTGENCSESGYVLASTLLRAGADPTLCDERGYTALAYAAAPTFTNPMFANDRHEICQAILNTFNKSRLHVLEERAREHHPSLLVGRMALETTAHTHKHHALQAHMRVLPDTLITTPTYDGQTPLTIALKQGNTLVLKEFAKCFTYAEIKEAIHIAKKLKRYPLLLFALLYEENAPSICEEACTHKDFALIQDLYFLHTNSSSPTTTLPFSDH